MKEKIKITGMSCAACAAAIETSVKKINGVKDAGVNFATESLSVDYDSSKLSKQAIYKTITDLGYGYIEDKDKNMERAFKEKEIKTLKVKFIVSLCFGLPLLYIAMSHMVGLPLPHFIDPMANPIPYAITQIVLLLPILWAGSSFYIQGTKALIKKVPNMDTLIAIGTSAAIIYSIYSTVKIFQGDAHYAMNLYFETAGVIITFVLLGKMLEAVSKGKTSQAIKKLLDLSPKTAIILVDGHQVEVDINQVSEGATVVVKPGSAFPVDGVISKGYTFVDQSMLTGESIPVKKEIGDEVFGGTINDTGYVEYTATKVGGDTVLSQIINLVEEAQSTKAPIAKMADKISLYFVPAVLIIASLAAIIWLFVEKDITFALTIFVSVLVIACPCALGLATPTAIMVGTGKGAEKGILIKNSEALELCHQVTKMVFDKTGTITYGKPQVSSIITNPDNPEITLKELVGFSASAEKGSEHPLAAAYIQKAIDERFPVENPSEFKAHVGKGIEATVENHKVLIGKPLLFDEFGIDISALYESYEELSMNGETTTYVAIDGKLAGLIGVKDLPKESSKEAIAKIKSMGIEPIMITGDNYNTAKSIAAQVGIDTVIADVFPKDKAKEIVKLQMSGAKVAMIGDGINDAPALAQADVGIAIGSGTDIAIESAEIVLLHDDLMDVAETVTLSNKTIRNIKQNLFWAFGYNVVGIPIAAGLLYAFGGPLLNPIFAALAMSLSSVSVLLNALRLKLN